MSLWGSKVGHQWMSPQHFPSSANRAKSHPKVPPPVPILMSYCHRNRFPYLKHLNVQQRKRDRQRCRAQRAPQSAPLHTKMRGIRAIPSRALVLMESE